MPPSFTAFLSSFSNPQTQTETLNKSGISSQQAPTNRRKMKGRKKISHLSISGHIRYLPSPWQLSNFTLWSTPKVHSHWQDLQVQRIINSFAFNDSWSHMCYRNCLYNMYQSTHDWVVFYLHFIYFYWTGKYRAGFLKSGHCPAELAQTLIKFNYLWFVSDPEDFD